VILKVRNNGQLKRGWVWENWAVWWRFVLASNEGA
jgi:hypothetical protein